MIVFWQRWPGILAAKLAKMDRDAEGDIENFLSFDVARMRPGVRSTETVRASVWTRAISLLMIAARAFRPEATQLVVVPGPHQVYAKWFFEMLAGSAVVAATVGLETYQEMLEALGDLRLASLAKAKGTQNINF